MPEIILKNVSKRFGKFVAVDNLNLNIDSNSFDSVIQNSISKSTLISNGSTCNIYQNSIFFHL